MQPEKRTVDAESRDDGSYVVKKTKKSSILAFILCILIAFVIWAYAEATEKSQAEKTPVSETATAYVSAESYMDEI